MQRIFIYLKNRAAAKRFEKQEETKKFIESFVIEQQIWKQRDMERQQKENESIAQYSASISNRDNEIKANKDKKRAAKEKIYSKVSWHKYINVKVGSRNGIERKAKRRVGGVEN
jgi:fumarylacetoacetate (FAA) hydrolase family protein